MMKFAKELGSSKERKKCEALRGFAFFLTIKPCPNELAQAGI
jgi:hypothetical protein